jgi:hypothetical protein
MVIVGKVTTKIEARGQKLTGDRLAVFREVD